MENNVKNKEFLQSEEWREFQEKAGNKTFSVKEDGFWANIVEHELPIVGKYFYVPKGPIIEMTNNQFPMTNKIQNSNDKIKNGMQEIIELAKKNKAGWIRIDLENKSILEIIRNSVEMNGNKLRIAKAPHDMQPREIFVIDISKNSEELLGEMSQKTRYNIRLAEKRGVKVFTITNNQDTRYKQIPNSNDQKNTKKYIDEFLRLVKATARRKGISFHAEDYYRKMIESLPENMLKLYVAEYNNKVIAANLVVFYNETATYLHGATDDEYRNVMAPHLLQWQAILDAKAAGCKKYDFGGIKTAERSDLTPTLSLLRRGRKGEVNSWAGITKFKLGFSPSTRPVEFTGSYDIILNRKIYALYRVLQKVKELFVKIKK